MLYVSANPPVRLVVFVHGFGGKAVKTWQQFPECTATDEWWNESDLLFVEYKSRRETIKGVADRIRESMDVIFPMLPTEVIQIGGHRAREVVAPYEELYLVGHSLGGVIVRKAVCDSAREWLDHVEKDTSTPIPPLAKAHVRLFSPAISGFRPAGWLGFLNAGPSWFMIEMFLRRSSAYSDLQPDSRTLQDLRELTVRHAEDRRLSSLRATILWANPEDVVLPIDYPTDPTSASQDDRNHSTVCKPNPRYRIPWTFVETGKKTKSE